jgi:hypothetical protein
MLAGLKRPRLPPLSFIDLAEIAILLLAVAPNAGVDINHDLAVCVLRLELVEGRSVVAEHEARIDDGAQLPIGEPFAELR